MKGVWWGWEVMIPIMVVMVVDMETGTRDQY